MKSWPLFEMVDASSGVWHLFVVSDTYIMDVNSFSLVNLRLQHFDIGACNETSWLARNKYSRVHIRPCLNLIEQYLHFFHYFHVQRVHLHGCQWIKNKGYSVEKGWRLYLHVWRVELQHSHIIPICDLKVLCSIGGQRQVAAMNTCTCSSNRHVSGGRGFKQMIITMAISIHHLFHSDAGHYILPYWTEIAWAFSI